MMKRILALAIMLLSTPAFADPGTNGLTRSATVYHDAEILELTTAKTIAATTDATPVSVESTAHGYATGDKVFIESTTIGALDDKYWTITKVDADNYTLDGSTAPGSTASAGSTKKVISTGRSCGPVTGRSCFFAWGDSDESDYQGNSAVFNVMDADICFNSDTASNTDSDAKATIYRVINADTLNGSMQPSAASSSVLTFSTGDCFHAVTGRYWIETTTEPTDGTKTVVVSVTERSR